MHIGFDDTDSTRKGCTTYVAALLVAELEKFKVRFRDYPSLVRLNPNVPWKTRGNGALCLRIEFPQDAEVQLKEKIIELIKENSDLNWHGTDPGIVFLKSDDIPAEITTFTKRAIRNIVTLKEALQLIRKFHAEALGYNTQRGIIGALAAIGETFGGDYTYELIAYRLAENRGTKRQVDTASIFKMDSTLQPYTFNNVDYAKPRVIITPRGPDPILFGIRGETAEVVKKAFSMVKTLEPVERWMIFRTNQGTDAHLTRVETLKEIQPYQSIVVKGVVSRPPMVVPLRHVVFAIKDHSDEVDCAAYEPTGDLRKVARQLTLGDVVEVYGAVRKVSGKPLTVNLEKIHVLQLAPQFVKQNPACPKCGKRLKSMGQRQGFRCEKCGSRYNDVAKTEVAVARGLNLGLYATSPCSQRHLTKPLRRYGLEKHGEAMADMFAQWHS